MELRREYLPLLNVFCDVQSKCSSLAIRDDIDFRECALENIPNNLLLAISFLADYVGPDAYVEAYDQASNGKGAERHGNGGAWIDQPMFEIARKLGPIAGKGFMMGQAIKKIMESYRLEEIFDKERSRQEIMGSMVYLSGAVVYQNEIEGKPIK